MSEVKNRLPTLYSKNACGNIIRWEIYIENNKIIRKYGIKRFQVVEKTIAGKNKGKKNETTDEEQAYKEALTLWKKQIDKGYAPLKKEKLYEEYIKDKKQKGGSNFTTNSKTNHNFKDGIEFYPMLAKQFNNTFFNHTIVQPKLDGVRCIAYKHNGHIILSSRNNKQFPFFHHIRKALQSLPDHYMVDGEIYYHPENNISEQEKSDIFNNITSACGVRRSEPHPIEKQLEYHVFDVFDKHNLTAGYMERFYKNPDKTLQKVLTSSSHIRIVEFDMLKKPYLDNFKKAYEKYMKKGYEGIMIRNNDGPYEQKKRSKYLMKYKEFRDDEYTIVDAKQGTGTEKGCVVWKCKTKDGKCFDVRPLGSFEKRKQMYQEYKKYIGKNLTVKYQNLGTDGIPRFPVGISIRDYE